MECYFVGKSEDDPGLPEWMPEYKWVVHWYEPGDYCGDGEAVAYDGDKLFEYHYGHCSCFGPWEAGWNNERADQTVMMTVTEWMARRSVFDRSEVDKKVIELLAARGCCLTERDSFLLAIMQNPEDHTLRLIYADWLEEHGEKSQADRIRLT